MARLALLCLFPTWVAAAPTTFEPVIGSALLCRDQTDPAYFRSYLTAAFKQPYKSEGGADWFKPDSGQRLFGLELMELFVSEEGSRYFFVGAVFKEKLEDARKGILESKGITFSAFSPTFPEQEAVRSPEGAFLLRYDTRQSKLYCVRKTPNP